MREATVAAQATTGGKQLPQVKVRRTALPTVLLFLQDPHELLSAMRTC